MAPRYVNRYFLFIAVILSFQAISCKEQVDIFEKNTAVPHYKWQYDFPVSGSFAISDTTSLYKIYIVLRHTDSYKYNNIWLNVGMQFPGDSMQYRKIDLQLGSDAEGWEGTGMNDIWEVRKLLNARFRFKKAGEYKFNITHIMRDNPLPGIMSAGIRVQKADYPVK